MQVYIKLNTNPFIPIGLTHNEINMYKLNINETTKLIRFKLITLMN